MVTGEFCSLRLPTSAECLDLPPDPLTCPMSSQGGPSWNKSVSTLGPEEKLPGELC
jgi:hypothetical protein